MYHADLQARKMLEYDNVVEQIKKLFGNRVITSQQQVDRKSLASIVFNDKNKLETLNNLIHPLVEEDFSKWCNLHLESDYILHEAAILFESGFDRLFDANILVTAPEELCIARVMARDSITKEMVEHRIQNQWSQDKKQKMAQYEVINDENALVIPQVLAIHRQIINK